VHLAERGAVGHRYFVVNSDAVRMGEFAATFARLARRPLRVWRMPAVAARVVDRDPSSGPDLSDAVFSNVRLRGTGFRFLYPTLEQGLQQVVGALDE
jgi:NAD dependent epimerase/dehydratase family enzyme